VGVNSLDKNVIKCIKKCISFQYVIYMPNWRHILQNSSQTNVNTRLNGRHYDNNIQQTINALYLFSIFNVYPYGPNTMSELFREKIL